MVNSKVNPVPTGFSTVTPYLTVSNAMKALEFYQAAFGAQLLWCMQAEGVCLHAELRIGNAMIMVQEEVPMLTRRKSPSTLGGSTMGLVIYVEDVDRWFDRAVAAGATVTSPPKLRYWGDINAFITDPFGHTWTIARRMEELPLEEAQRRTQEHWRQLVAMNASTQDE